MQKLTPRQLKAFDFIRSHTHRVGYAPTLREICDYMGYKAVGSAQDVIASLRKKGFITTPHKQVARSLTLSDKGKALYGVKVMNQDDDADSFLVPCLGAVPAGMPLEAIEDHSGYLRVSASLLPRSVSYNKLFALQAKGLSMIQAGILDCDWLIIQQQNEAPHGTIVVAQVGGSATVKRLCLDSRRGWYLKPENPSFEPMYADQEAFTILGRVVALQRTLFDFN
ncbi:MAG: transcriptional repressor LexA [Proteobacteria bacterium]|nr:transcriptional repressor LexA [Pseudomonadota bacterium]